MENNLDNILDYDLIVEDSLRNVVRKSIEIVEKNGFMNDHHFFIAFNLKYPGVIVPKELKISSNKNNEVKIILQHQFWNLKSDKDKFSVTLSFNGKKKDIVVPYKSVFSFSDPSVGFTLQFKSHTLDNKNIKKIGQNNHNEKKLINAKNKKNEAEIFLLDKFRSKKEDN